DQVWIVFADHRSVGRYHDHLELVDLVELLGLRHGGTGHAGEPFVEAEGVLIGDGGERLGLLPDLDPFFRLHGLVQAIRPARAWPEMISGVRASSIRMLSTSSTMAKFRPRCTHCVRSTAMLSRR